ncbi:cytochrome P450 [Aspergillus pseudodeflectus]|uniref:Cytochrome P450 n=1 Tax=Aspergillus pseudodeflectus TaxID=176178 RepID=A0ABR4JWG2_9EURO
MEVTVTTFLLASLIFLTLRSIYRLWYHPLSHIPGPPLAAITHLYEAYHDIVRGGLYVWEIEKMHDKYGPVVRFNPREVHIRDPYYFNTIYCASSLGKRNKDTGFPGVHSVRHSLLTTLTHQKHRQRRALLETVMAPPSVKTWEPIIREHIAILMKRFSEAPSGIVDLNAAFAALTADTVGRFLTGESLGALNAPGFRNDMHEGSKSGAAGIHLLRLFPAVAGVLSWIPLSVLRFLGLPLGQWLEFLAVCGESARKALKESKETTNAKGQETEAKNAPAKRSFYAALIAGSTSDEEQTIARLQEEAMVFLLAGNHTTAGVMTLAVYHLALMPEITTTLRKELATLPVPANQASWKELQELPYLTGVVKEALRLSQGASLRSARISPDRDLVCNGIVLPAGTPLSQQTVFVSMDTEIFPNPQCFDPTRWGKPAPDAKGLDTYLASFGKGTRNCIGKSLASAIMLLTLAALVPEFDLTLANGTKIDLVRWRDMGTPFPMDPNNQEVKVQVAQAPASS